MQGLDNDLNDAVVGQPDQSEEVARDIEDQPILPEGLTDRERRIPNIGFTLKF